MKTWAILLLCGVLAACTSAPVAPPQRPEALFHDDLFAAPSQRINADDVFALSDDMRRYLTQGIAWQLHSAGLQQGLIDALYSREQLKLEYDSAMTRNAAQAFDARSGNCLSLVIMTAAFAKELGLRVQYQSVLVDEAWSRSGGMYFSSGHVNLTLGRRFINALPGYNTNQSITIDFLPIEDTRGQHTRVIAEATVVAMYMNNRAAESLAQGQVDDAYWWARAGIEHMPTFLSAYNTLGVVYLRHGNLPQAEQVLQDVVAREPGNASALSNLALVLDRQGRTAEAETRRRQLAQIEPYPPFHFFDLGIEAMHAGDYAAAKRLFAKEIDRAAYHHEFHFWLGVANFRLGDLKEARKHLTIALENSTTRSTHDLYAAKLDWLRSYHRPQ